MQKKVKFLLLKKSTTNISLKEAIKKMVKKEGKVFLLLSLLLEFSSQDISQASFCVCCDFYRHKNPFFFYLREDPLGRQRNSHKTFRKNY